MPWRVGGRRRRRHCLQRVTLYGERRLRKGEEKEREGTGKRIPACHVHFQVMRGLGWIKITGYWFSFCCDKFLEDFPQTPYKSLSDSTVSDLKAYRHHEMDFGLDKSYPDLFVVPISFFLSVLFWRMFSSSQSSVAYLVSLTIIFSIAITYFWTVIFFFSSGCCMNMVTDWHCQTPCSHWVFFFPVIASVSYLAALCAAAWVCYL